MTIGMIHKNFDSVTVSNTTTATEIFRFDFKEYQNAIGGDNCGILGPNGAMRVTVFGLFNANYGGAMNVSFEATMGSESLGTLNADLPAGFPYFTISYTLLSKGAGSGQQLIIRELEIGDTGGNINEARTPRGGNNETLELTEDSLFVLKSTNSVASTSLEVTKLGATVEFL